MKKRSFIIFLIAKELLLSGCYTFRDMNYNENIDEYRFINNDIKLNLKNGQEIYSRSLHHTFNSDSERIYIGKGGIYSSENKISINFEGIIFESEIDSFNNDQNHLFIWLNNHNRITFMNDDYVELKPDSKKVLTLMDDGNFVFLDKDMLEAIMVDEYNSSLTLLVVLVITGAIAIGWIASGSQSTNSPLP